MWSLDCVQVKAMQYHVSASICQQRDVSHALYPLQVTTIVSLWDAPAPGTLIRRSMTKNGAEDNTPDRVLFVDHEITNGNFSASGDNCHERRAEKHVVLSSFSSAVHFGRESGG